MSKVDLDKISEDFSAYRNLLTQIENDEGVFDELFKTKVQLEKFLKFLPHSKNRKPLEILTSIKFISKFLIYAQKNETDTTKLLDFCEILLVPENIQSFYSSLKSDYKENASRIGVLSLISVILSINSECAKLLLKRIDFSHESFREILYVMKKAEPESKQFKDIRMSILNISFAVFLHDDKNLEFTALMSKGLLNLIINDIDHDSEDNQIYLLKILEDKVLNNEIVSKNIRTKILSKNVLAKIFSVYKVNRHEIDKAPVCSQVLGLLRKILKTKDGFVFSVKTAILSSRLDQIPNKFILELIFSQGVLELLEDEEISDFVHLSLISCPDIIGSYLEKFLEYYKYEYAFDSVNEKVVTFLFDFIGSFYHKSYQYLAATTCDLFECVPKNVDHVADILLGLICPSGPLVKEFLTITEGNESFHILANKLVKRNHKHFSHFINWLNTIASGKQAGLGDLNSNPDNQALIFALQKQLKIRYLRKMDLRKEQLIAIISSNKETLKFTEKQILVLPNGKNALKKTEEVSEAGPVSCQTQQEIPRLSDEELISCIVGKKLTGLCKEFIDAQDLNEEVLNSLLPRVVKCKTKILLIQNLLNPIVLKMVRDLLCACEKHTNLNIFAWDNNLEGCFNLTHIIESLETSGNLLITRKTLLSCYPLEMTVIREEPELKIAIEQQKRELVKMLYHMARLNPDYIRGAINSQLLWSSYSGTMSETDIYLLRMLYIVKPPSFKTLINKLGGLVYGRRSLDCVNFQENSLSLADSPLVWKLTDLKSLVQSFDDQRMALSINSFPTLYHPTWPSDQFVNDSIYDPAFLIYVTSQCFRFGCNLEEELYMKGFLAISIMGMSSYSSLLRQLATANVMRFLEKCQAITGLCQASSLEHDEEANAPQYKKCKFDYSMKKEDDKTPQVKKFPHALRIQYLLTVLRQSLVPEAVKALEGTFRGTNFLWPPKADTRQRLTKVIALFFARLVLPSKKNVHMHNLQWNICMGRPTVKVTEMPDFMRLVYSVNLEYKDERLWTLHFLADAVKDKADFLVAERSRVTKNLLALFCSPNLEPPAKVAILEYLRNITSYPSIIRRLIEDHSFMYWLLQNTVQSRQDLMAAFKRLLENLSTQMPKVKDACSVEVFNLVQENFDHLYKEKRLSV